MLRNQTPKEKSLLTAYALWLFGFHYLYLRRPGVFLLYFFTGGGLLVWALIDLFRLPSMVGRLNAFKYTAPPVGVYTNPVPPAPDRDPMTLSGIVAVGVLVFIVTIAALTLRSRHLAEQKAAIAAANRAAHAAKELLADSDGSDTPTWMRKAHRTGLDPTPRPVSGRYGYGSPTVYAPNGSGEYRIERSPVTGQNMHVR